VLTLQENMSMRLEMLLSFKLISNKEKADPSTSGSKLVHKISNISNSMWLRHAWLLCAGFTHFLLEYAQRIGGVASASESLVTLAKWWHWYPDSEVTTQNRTPLSTLLFYCDLLRQI